MENPRPAHLRPKSRPHCGRLASETRLLARCGAVWLAGGRVSAPGPISCTLFDLPVHAVTSSVSFALPQAARLTHSAAPPLQTATASLGCGLVQAAACYPPGISEAAQRRAGRHAEPHLSLRSASDATPRCRIHLRPRKNRQCRPLRTGTAQRCLEFGF